MPLENNLRQNIKHCDEFSQFINCPFADFEKTRGIKALMQKETGDF
jgi:hypothetical protein